MVTVPKYGQSGGQSAGAGVDLRPLATGPARIGSTPADFGAAPAVALEQAGARIQALAADVERTAALERERDDAAQAMAVYAKAADATRTLLYDPERGLFNTRGAQAFDAQDAAARHYDEAGKAALEGLQTPGQRRAFEAMWARRRESDLDAVDRHVSRQRQIWLDDTAGALVKTAVADAATRFNDERAVQSALDLATRAVLANNQGQGADVVDLKVKTARSAIHLGVIERMAAADPLAASAWRDKHAADLYGDDGLKADHLLKPQVLRARARQEADRIAGTGAAADVSRRVGAEADRAGVDRGLALTTAWIESRFGTAKDPTVSTAKGVFQFLDQSWKAAGGTDADRSDVGRQIELGVGSLKATGAALARDLGRTAAPWEVYLTHQQGAAGGPALLKADANAPAVAVLRPFYDSEAKATAAVVNNGGAKDMTAGQFRDLWRGQYEKAAASVAGMALGTATAPPDLGSWLAAADRISDPELRDAVSSRLITEHGRQEAVLNERRRDIRQQAMRHVVSDKGSLETLAPSVLAALDPESMRSLQAFEERRARGVDPPFNAGVYAELSRMQAYEPAKFRDADLLAYADKLPHAEWMGFQNKQTAMREGVRRDATKEVPVREALSVSKGLLEEYGRRAKLLDHKGRETTEFITFKNGFEAALLKELEAFQVKSGKPPGEDDILKIADRMLIFGRRKGSGGWLSKDQTAPAFEAENDANWRIPYDDIPAERRAVVVDQLRGAGKAHGKEDIEKAYTAWRKAGNR